MKKYLFLYIFSIVFVGAAGFPVMAGEAPSVDTARAAAAMSDELISARAASGTTAWNSSLSGIEQAAVTVADTNSKLSMEFQALDGQIKALGEAILGQKALNGEHLLALQQRKDEIAAPQQAIGVKYGLDGLERSVAQARAQLSILQTKARALDSKISLRKLKMTELELNEKTILVERQSSESSVLTALRSEVASLKDQVVSQEQQEQTIRGKLEALQKDEKPYVAEARMLGTEIDGLNKQLAEASSREAGLSDQLVSLQAKAENIGNDKTVARYTTLLKDKAALEGRVNEVEARIGDLGKAGAEAPKKAEELKGKLESLEKQNKAISSEVDDLRENIAVLEYKISSLERYQNRNRKRGR